MEDVRHCDHGVLPLKSVPVVRKGGGGFFLPVSLPDRQMLAHMLMVASHVMSPASTVASSPLVGLAVATLSG